MPRRSLKVGLVAVLFLAGALLVGFQLLHDQVFFQIGAKYTELNALPVNVTDDSIGVWWRNDKPLPGCATLTNVDTQQALSQCGESGYVHLINFSNLGSENKYAIAITSGDDPVSLSPFFGIYTQTFPAKNRVPLSVIGSVVLNGDPVSNATVFISPNLSDQFYYPQTVTTDSDGTFVFDLSYFFLKNLAPIDSYFFEITDSTGRKLMETTKTADEISAGNINIIVQ